jgi:MSHA pilin protein MshD
MTLIELIMFIVIVSVGLAGVLASLNVSVKGSADPLQPKQALAIAEGLMEEVLLKNYNNPPAPDFYDPTDCAATTPTNCDRSRFDHIGDFSGFHVAPVSSYTAVVTIAAENTTDLGVAARRITVTVTQPNSQTVALIGYRANY